MAEFARGLSEDQARFGLSLLGGDMSATPGPLSIAVDGVRPCAARRDDPPLRCRARRRRLRHRHHRRQRRRALRRAKACSSNATALPEPPVAFGQRLRGLASAAIDVSDGLLADLGHIAEVSGVRIVVEAERIPRSDALRALWGDGIEAIVRAATAGDDYQIAFTAPLAKETEIAIGERTSHPHRNRGGGIGCCASGCSRRRDRCAAQRFRAFLASGEG